MAGKKNNYNKSGKARAHKDILREEALERDKARAKRSAKEQLSLIASRPGESKRESVKLQNAINSQEKNKKK